jgi:hypothetical protein
VRDIVMLPTRTRLPPDGLSSSALVLLTLDEFGYPVANAPIGLRLVRGDGQLPAKATTDAARLTQAYHLALNRDPKPKELDSLTAFLQTQRDTFKSTPEDATKLTHIGLAPNAPLDPIEHAAWTQLARVLLNTQETITRY